MDSFRIHNKKYGQSVITWPFFCAMAKLNRKEGLSCTVVGHDLQSCPADQNNWRVKARPTKVAGYQLATADKAAMFSNGAFITIKGIKVIIGIMKDLKPRFDSIERHSAIWNDIQVKMAAQGFHYDVKLMSRTFNSIVSKFKN
ncbi:COMPASS component BRE2 [Frankliniella fusca]|uniref:COMPASS component BRE2 n=1 Tax=Frankliniella fusca TaxID=407009 RepID=A0AAE1H9Y8_9NEOP|nr:COMPASS component BRE2 [Frankliniella fusca]